jgi:hypothetical protein
MATTQDKDLNKIREQIKVILQGVTGIGVVHDRIRMAIDTAKMLNLFKDSDGRINTIMFRREKMIKRSLSLGAPKVRAHVFLFIVIRGFNDAQASELEFDDLLTDIEERFDSYDDLNGACMSCDMDTGPMADLSGMQIDVIEPRMFGSVLCHYAEMRLQVVERHAT